MTVTIPFVNPVSLANNSVVITQTLGDGSTKIASTAFISNALASFVGQVNIVTVGTIITGVWNGTFIAIANGGTGTNTANGALNGFLPSQSGNVRRHLQTDGSNTSWGIVGLTPTASQVGSIYTSLDGDLVIVNSSTHATILPAPTLGKQVGVIMINPTVTSVMVKTPASGQNINGIDRSVTGFPITSQYDVYIFVGTSATDWVIQATSRITKVISITGAQDGTNKIFTLGNILIGFTLQFYENGQLLSVTNDYTLSGASLTYVALRNAPLITDNLTAYAVPVQ